MASTVDVRKKLYFGFTIPVVTIALLVLAVYLTLSHVEEQNHAVESVSRHSFEMAMIGQKMRLNVVQVQQWLTDISATRGLDGLDDGFSEAEKNSAAFKEGLAEFHRYYQDTGNNEKLLEIEELGNRFQTYYETGKKMANAYIMGGPAEGNKTMGEFDAASSDLNEILTPLISGQTLQGSEMLNSMNELLDIFVKIVTITGILVIILTAIAAFLTCGAIITPLKKLIFSLRGSANEIIAVAESISTASNTLADSSSEQAAGVEETSASLQEMTNKTSTNADHALEANNLVKETSAVVDNANEAMKELNGSMLDISKASEDISNIIKTIDEIAFQTNLLALNAAVEAARAGEAGAGFAVVADEVRNLALRATEAAKSTSQLIEETVNKINNGTRIVANTEKTFVQVHQSSSSVSELVSLISHATTELAGGIRQSSIAIADIEKTTQQNAATAEEAHAAADIMHSQADQLNTYVNNLVTMVGGLAEEKEQSTGSVATIKSIIPDKLNNLLART